MRVVSAPTDLAFQCVNNVKAKVKRFGGEEVHGWAILVAENVVVGNWHAVWRYKDQLLDVTPSEYSETLFIELEGVVKMETVIEHGQECAGLATILFLE